jgi:hypothetical protein
MLGTILYLYGTVPVLYHNIIPLYAVRYLYYIMPCMYAPIQNTVQNELQGPKLDHRSYYKYIYILFLLSTVVCSP